MLSQTFRLKNVTSDCCMELFGYWAKEYKLQYRAEKQGIITIRGEASQIDQFIGYLDGKGFPRLMDKDLILVEQIKQAVYDLVHFSTFNAMVRNSDFLVEKFNHSYQYLSSLFSKHSEYTLEKYIIIQKIDKVKSLLVEEDLSLSEIAYMMGYSSVQYLSTQFKQVVGISVTEFRRQN